ncbi:MAG: alkaline phosphatase family protein [Gaiellaceae bacterium]
MTGPRRLPEYGGRCFAELPALIERLLGGGGGSERPASAGGLLRAEYDRVVFVYLDAFGWRFLERHGEHPLLRRAHADGQVERWTSQFPSTTTAHVTTMQSGLPVGLHGVYEWNVYEPRLDRLITPLPFSFAGDHEPGTLLAAGIDPADVFPAETLYERLEVACHTAQPAELATSPVSRHLLRGATVHPFEEAAGGLAGLAAALAAAERAFGAIYLPDADTAMHLAGPDAPAGAALFDAALTALERARFPAGTLVLLTADHGMEAISPERSVYVNVLWPELGEHLATGADGKPLAPAGSARDLFLHVRPDRLDDVVARLRSLLDGSADVERVDGLVAAGVFGPEVSDALLARLANLVVLPHAGEAVYWLEPGRFEQRFRGQHGGLSPNEMEIPLVAYVV